MNTTVIVMLIIIHLADGKQTYDALSFDDREHCEMLARTMTDDDIQALCINASRLKSY